MTCTYLVSMPKAEARYLAGQDGGWPASPEARCLAAIHEWLHGLSRRRSATIPVARVVADLTAILALVPPQTKPSHGPFAPPADGKPPLPGEVEYLGSGIVRLDEEAISSLSRLPPDHDFRVTFTDAGPVLTVGPDNYLAREQGPGLSPAEAPASPGSG